MHHVAFGLTPHGVRLLDEGSGRSRVLTYFGRNSNPTLLAADPQVNRLLVEDLRIDREQERDENDFLPQSQAAT